MSVDQTYKEKELLLRIANGNEEAFRSIYDAHFGKVYAMALDYIPDAFIAQDMVQEVFSRIWLKRAELPAIHNLEAWLITVTRNLLINYLRKITPLMKWRDLQTTDATDGALSETRESVDYRELEKLIQQAIAQLSPRQREIYQFSRIEGHSHKEIAEQLGISIDVSREHLSKALGNIRTFLRQKYGPLGLLACATFYI